MEKLEINQLNSRMIHSLTSIHPDARLGARVKVDPFTMIHQNVQIEKGPG